MKKGQVELIFEMAIIIIIVIVASKFFYSFMGATPAVQAQQDLQGTIELVCSTDGPSISSLELYIPKTDDVSGNPKFQKLHLASDGALELYKCAGTGASCSNGGLEKTSVLNCPPGTAFADCWVTPTTESISVVVKKDAQHKISFNETSGVICQEISRVA